MLYSPDQSETPWSLGSEWLLNTMEAMTSLVAVHFTGTKPFVPLFPIFMSIIYSVTLCLIPWLLSFLKIFYRRPCQEPSSDPCRSQQMMPLPYMPVDPFELGLQFPLQSHCDYPEESPGLLLPCSLSHFILIYLLQPSGPPTCRPLYTQLCKCPSQCNILSPTELTSSEGTEHLAATFSAHLPFSCWAPGWALQTRGSTDCSERVFRR